MSAVWKKAMADMRRRRLQAVVVTTVVLLSSLAGTMAVSLLVESDAPFDHAFAQSSGPHLTVHFDTSQVTEARLRATSTLSSVAAIGGPWHETPLEVNPAGGPRVPISILGRADPAGAVDRLLLTAGRWVQDPGEIVLAQRFGKGNGYAVGDSVTAAPGQGVDSLRVVGIAAAVNDGTDGWVTPAQASAIHPAAVGGKPVDLVHVDTVMYRLHAAATHADIDAAAQQIGAATSAPAIRDTSNWLDQKLRADTTVAVMIPFLLAFSGFALVAAALIVGNVVSGAVIAGYREIGIMKSIGFTPLQVVGTFVVQMLVPAAIGAAVGIAAGVVASQPFLAQTAASFDLPQAAEAVPAVVTGCLVAVLAIVLAATVMPGLRAGRMSAVEAITAGSSPGGRSGRVGGRIMAGLPLPRAAGLGLADAVARPVRSGMTLVAVAIGVSTITFAVGLTRSLDLVKHALTRDQVVQVSVIRDSGGDKGSGGVQSLSDAQVVALIQRQPGTARFISGNQLQVRVEGVGPQVELFGYRGDSSWIGFALLSGRWFSGPGEAVAPQALLDAAHKKVGDSVLVSLDGREESLRLVGTIFDQQNGNILLRADWSALTAISPTLEPRAYEIQVSGVSPGPYAQRLDGSSGSSALGVRTPGDRGIDTAFLLIQSVLGGLALVLTGIALAGVFNTVVLNTREKARDTAILRALGMTPGQVVSMVLTSVALIGVAGVILGIPAGELLQRQVLTVMGKVAASTQVPASFYNVYPLLMVMAIGVAGLGVALAGAWLPAVWAARARVSAILSAE
jgi:putative ABC transport system permease protein